MSGNVDRGRKNEYLLKAQGWLVIRVWEHEIKESLPSCVERLVMILSEQRIEGFPDKNQSKL